MIVVVPWSLVNHDLDDCIDWSNEEDISRIDWILTVKWDNNWKIENYEWITWIRWNNFWEINTDSWNIEINWDNEWVITNYSWNTKIRLNNSWKISTDEWSVEIGWNNKKSIYVKNWKVKIHWKNTWTIELVHWQVIVESTGLNIDRIKKPECKSLVEKIKNLLLSIFWSIWSSSKNELSWNYNKITINRVIVMDYLSKTLTIDWVIVEYQWIPIVIKWYQIIFIDDNLIEISFWECKIELKQDKTTLRPK